MTSCRGHRGAPGHFPTCICGLAHHSFLSVLCFIGFTSRFQPGLCQKVIPHFSSSPLFGCPHLIPRHQAKRPSMCRWECLVPASLPRSKGSSCMHRAQSCAASACHCHCTNESFHWVGLGVTAWGVEGLAAETGVGTAPVDHSPQLDHSPARLMQTPGHQGMLIKVKLRGFLNPFGTQGLGFKSQLNHFLAF